MTDETYEEHLWAVANNIFTVIVHRDGTDSWRETVIKLLAEVHTDGYWEGRA